MNYWDTGLKKPVKLGVNVYKKKFESNVIPTMEQNLLSILENLKTNRGIIAMFVNWDTNTHRVILAVSRVFEIGLVYGTLYATVY